MADTEARAGITVEQGENGTDAESCAAVRSETAALQAVSRPTGTAIVAGIAVVLVLGALTRYFDTHVPRWAVGTPLQRVAKSIEFPVYAIAIGLLGNVVLSKLALRDRLSAGFRTEFFIKTGNIDTTAAVAASGAIAGEQALQIATIVKTTQNALIGLVAIALTGYFTLRVERVAGAARPSARGLWERFPKFVLGFVAASVIGTLYL